MDLYISLYIQVIDMHTDAVCGQIKSTFINTAWHAIKIIFYRIKMGPLMFGPVGTV